MNKQTPIKPKAKPSEEQILEVSSNLEHFEVWCEKNDVALSALGRTVLQDQAVLYRWRSRGVTGASPEKRRQLAIYILQHPDGIPGYRRSRTGKRGHRSAAFQIDKTPSSSTSGQNMPSGPSTSMPVPALSALESREAMDYVKNQAFKRQVAIAVVLSELVTLGIRCQLEQIREQEENEDDLP